MALPGGRIITKRSGSTELYIVEIPQAVAPREDRATVSGNPAALGKNAQRGKPELTRSTETIADTCHHSSGRRDREDFDASKLVSQSYYHSHADVGSHIRTLL